MLNLWTWAIAAVVPLAKRVLIALGIGVLTYGGYSVLVDSLKTHVIEKWGQIPTTTLNVLTLAGFTEAFGIVLGAIAVRVGIGAMSRLGRIQN